MSSPQLAEFEALVGANLNPDNAIRSQAESILTNMRQTQPSMFMLALLALLRESSQGAPREFAAVILRQNLLANSSSPVWNQLTPEVKKQVQAGLLFLFQNEPLRSLRRLITDCVAATATRIAGVDVSSERGFTRGIVSRMNYATDERGVARGTRDLQTAVAKTEKAEVEATPWPELMPTIMALAQANQPQFRESLCDLIGKLAEFNPKLLLPYLQFCKQIIVGGMKDAAIQTRLTALKSCVSLLVDLSEEDREHMKDTVPLMFEILGAAYQQADEETIVTAVQQLTNLAELNRKDEDDDNINNIGAAVKSGAKFLKNHIKPILGAMITMVASKSLEAETRRICFHFLLTLAEEGKGMIRKQGEFAQQVIPLAFSFLCELQDTPDWSDPNKVETGDDDEDFENYRFGLTSMDQLSGSLGGKVFLTVAKPIIDQGIKDPNWNVRHAVLMTIAKSAVGCSKQLEPELKNLMNLFVVPFALRDPHHRVRWAAIQLCAHLAEAFEPDFSNDYTKEIFETLLACIEPSNHWRVIAEGCLCFPDITRGMDQDVLAPWMDRFLTALVPLLNMTQYPKVIENALGAIATIAAVADDKFIPYYDHFMPGVKGLFMSNSGAHQKHIRKRSIECIGMMAQAVGAEKFRPEFAGIMDVLLQMVNSDMPADDPQYGEVQTTMARICRCMKLEFVPYLDRVLPRLIHSAAINDACVIVNEGDQNLYKGKEGYSTASVEIRGTGIQHMSYNSSLLEEKSLALRMLFEHCNTVIGAFLPWASKVAEIAISCVRYQFNPQVRQSSTYLLPPLMECVKEALAKDRNTQVTQCRQLFTAMWPELIAALKVEFDLEVLGELVDTFREVVELVPFQLTVAETQELNTLIYRLVCELLARCKARDDERNTEDFDEAQEELFELQNEAEDEFLGHVYNLINQLVKNGRETYLVDFHEKLQDLFSSMMKSEDVSLRTSGICVMSQVMEDCPTHPLTQSYCEPVYKICVESMDDQDTALKQSSLFGLGVCAMITKQGFAQFAPEIMTKLYDISKNNTDPDQAVATDNAISAMGKIFVHTYNSGAPVNGVQTCPPAVLAMMSHWVHFLPCDGDQLESIKIHDLLIQFITTNNPVILGENFSNLPVILGIFGKILGRTDWKDICSPTAYERMIEIFKQVQQGMPEAAVKSLFQAMSAEQRAVFAPHVINPAILQGL